MSRPRPLTLSPAAPRPTTRWCRFGALGAALVVPALLWAAPVGAATAPVGLGTAASFAVLAGAGITNVGPTTITGDVGTFATTNETGFNTVTLLGVDHAGDAVTQQGKNDLTTAFNQAAGSGPPVNLADELGGLTLTPGVYNGAALQITGTLTLDTLGDPNAVFIFQTGSTLTTASSSNVLVLGGATACNVYWQVPSSTTLGTSSHLIGTVMASTSITATTGATIQGRLLASTGAVTLDSNTITVPVCAPPSPTTTTAAVDANGGPGNGTPTTAAPTATTTSARPGLAAPVPTTTTTPDSTTNGGTPPLAFTGSSTRSMTIAVTGAAMLVSGASLLRVRRTSRR